MVPRQLEEGQEEVCYSSLTREMILREIPGFVQNVTIRNVKFREVEMPLHILQNNLGQPCVPIHVNS